MAKYLEKAKEIKIRIDELVADYPGLTNDPRFAQIMYECIKAMPRVQGTVRKSFMQAIVGHLFKLTRVIREIEYGHRAGETYECLSIEGK